MHLRSWLCVRMQNVSGHFAEHISPVPDVRVSITAQEAQPFVRLADALRANARDGVAHGVAR